MNKEIKIFLIKLISIIIGIILIINTTYNLIFAEKIETLSKLLSFQENKIEIKEKFRQEIKRGLSKDKIFDQEDIILLKEFYLKIKNEFE